MRSKLKKDLSTKDNRDFWAGVENAAKEFRELPQWEQDMLNRRWDEIHESYKNQVPTCHHCGAKLGNRSKCFPCYGG